MRGFIHDYTFSVFLKHGAFALLLLVLMACQISNEMQNITDRIRENRAAIEDNTAWIHANEAAVMSSTCAIQYNQAAVEASSQAILHNYKEIAETTAALVQNRSLIQESTEAIRLNKEVIQELTSLLPDQAPGYVTLLPAVFLLLASLWLLPFLGIMVLLWRIKGSLHRS